MWLERQQNWRITPIKRGKRWKIRRYMSSLMIRVTHSWKGWGCWYLHNLQLSPDSPWIPSAQCPARSAAPHRSISLCPLQASEPDASSEDSLVYAVPVSHAENQASLPTCGPLMVRNERAPEHPEPQGLSLLQLNPESVDMGWGQLQQGCLSS